MSATLPAERAATAVPPARLLRTDIQALRAVAIGLVVLNHLWPLHVTGGYVGVDVFFVISGFLITGHLMGEVTRTGGVRLGAFYARRIRRLLPAAFLVLAASLVLAFVFLPYPRWERNALEIAASAGYVENWFLAAMSVNYSAMNDAASLVQHYWSLSVEEQFYIFWPLLLLGGIAAARRLVVAPTRRARRARVTRGAVAVIAVVGLLSLSASIITTALAPEQAYFATFTRGWEFAAGAAVALIGTRMRLSVGVANLLSLIGFGAIAASALLYDHTTPFPGYTALVPVLGTAAVILAGNAHASLWHASVTTWRPIQWTGGVSYSLYLWHWPLIVATPFVIGGEANLLSQFGVLVIALLLAAVTKRFVEDRGQSWSFWRASTRRAMVLMLAGMLVIGALVTALLVSFHARVDADSPTSDLLGSACAGPRALTAGSDCADPFGPADYTVMTAKNEYFSAPEECGGFLKMLTYGDKRTTIECDFSQGAADPMRVWLIGDSHAQQWQGPLFDIARDEGWVLTTSYYGGCPIADVDFIGFRDVWGAPDVKRCRQWSKDLAAVIETEKPDLVVTAMASRLQLVDDASGRSQIDQMSEGLLADWTRWTAAGVRVLAVADPPFNAEVRNPDCVLLNPTDPRLCARPRSEALPTDPIVVAAQAAQDSAISVLDLSDRFCDDETCYAVVGGIPVYYDADHLNLEFARLLRPEIEEAVGRALVGSD